MSGTFLHFHVCLLESNWESPETNEETDCQTLKQEVKILQRFLRRENTNLQQSSMSVKPQSESYTKGSDVLHHMNKL